MSINLNLLLAELESIKKVATEKKRSSAKRSSKSSTRGVAHTQDGEPIVYRVGNLVSFKVSDAIKWSDEYNLTIETFYNPRVTDTGLLIGWNKKGCKVVVDNRIAKRFEYQRLITTLKVQVKPKGKDFHKILS